MSVAATLFAIVALIGFLTKENRRKSRKIKNLESLLENKILECEQLEKMIIQYGQARKKTKG